GSGKEGEGGSMTDLRRLLNVLASAEIEFILVGGAAATAHGASRLTQDIDIVYRRSAEKSGTSRIDSVSRICERLDLNTRNTSAQLKWLERSAGI
ncbi:MAG: hypothetical protein ACYC6Y_31975, partial [Thermoguttaceae bacterium]